MVGSRACGHYCDGALTSLLSGHCSLGAAFSAVVTGLKATDRNKGTKPVFKGVNPAAATTARIFAVFKMALIQARRSLDLVAVQHKYSQVQPKLRQLACSAVRGLHGRLDTGVD